MTNISQNVNIEMLEKLPDGTYKRKYPKTRSDTGVTFDEHLADYIHHAGYGTASGTNAKTITLDPVPTEYKEGMAVAFKNITENTGAVTININDLGAKAIIKSNGNPLSSENLKKDSIYTIRYNGLNFTLQGEGGEYGNAIGSDVLSGKTIGTENGLVTGTLVPPKKATGIISTEGSASGSFKTTSGNLIFNYVDFNPLLTFTPEVFVLYLRGNGVEFATFYMGGSTSKANRVIVHKDGTDARIINNTGGVINPIITASRILLPLFSGNKYSMIWEAYS